MSKNPYLREHGFGTRICIQCTIIQISFSKRFRHEASATSGRGPLVLKSKRPEWFEQRVEDSQQMAIVSVKSFNPITSKN